MLHRSAFRLTEVGVGGAVRLKETLYSSACHLAEIRVWGWESCKVAVGAALMCLPCGWLSGFRGGGRGTEVCRLAES